MPKFSQIRIRPGSGDIESHIGDGGGQVEESGKILKPKPPFIPPVGSPPFGNPWHATISFITLSTSPFLGSERRLVAGSGISLVDNGPNNDLIISVDPGSISPVDIFVNNSIVGSTDTLNFIGQNIDVRGSAGSSSIDIILSASLTGLLSVSLSSKGTGHQIIETVSGGSEIIQRRIAGAGTVEVSTLPTGTITISGRPLSVYVGGTHIADTQVLNFSGQNIDITTSAGAGGIDIVLSAAPSILQLSAQGTGVDIISSVSGIEINPRRISGGGIVEVSAKLDGTITVSAASPVFQLQANTLGTGLAFYGNVSGTSIDFRSFKAGLGLSAYVAADEIVVDNVWIHANSGNDFANRPYAVQNSIAIGDNVVVSGSNSIGIGNNILQKGNFNYIIGDNVTLSGDSSFSIVLGSPIGDVKDNEILIGFNSVSTTFPTSAAYNVILGHGNESLNQHSIVVGSFNFVDYDGTVAVRPNIAIGIGNYTTGEGAIVVGSSSVAAYRSILLGHDNQGQDLSFIAGFNNIARDGNNVIIGKDNVADYGSFGTTIIGDGVTTTISSALYIAPAGDLAIYARHGEVAIGHTSPQADFDVLGSSRFRGLIAVDGDSLYYLPTSAGTLNYVMASRGVNATAAWVDINTLVSFNNWIHANTGSNFDIAPSGSQPNSVAIGRNVIASADSAIAIGKNIENTISSSLAFGIDNNTLVVTDQKVEITTSGSTFIEFQNNVTTSGAAIGLDPNSNRLGIYNLENSTVSINIDGRAEVEVSEDYLTFSLGSFTYLGDSYSTIAQLRGTLVTANSWLDLLLPSGAKLNLEDNSAVLFEIWIVGREIGGSNVMGKKHRGVAYRNVGPATIGFADTPFDELIAETATAPDWKTEVYPDTVTGSLGIRVMVSSNTQLPLDIKWMAEAKLVRLKV